MNEKGKKSKKNNWSRLKGTTNFYPTYVEANNDIVTPTSAPYRTEFQSVIPRYELSMTETRDKGTGPTFLETSYQTTKNPHTKKSKSTFTNKKSSRTKSKAKPNKKKKIRTDLWQ